MQLKFSSKKLSPSISRFQKMSVILLSAVSPTKSAEDALHFASRFPLPSCPMAWISDGNLKKKRWPCWEIATGRHMGLHSRTYINGCAGCDKIRHMLKLIPKKAPRLSRRAGNITETRHVRIYKQAQTQSSSVNVCSSPFHSLWLVCFSALFPTT